MTKRSTRLRARPRGGMAANAAGPRNLQGAPFAVWTALALSACAHRPPRATEPPPPPLAAEAFDVVDGRAADLLAHLAEVDTRQPHGHEATAARRLFEFLRRAGLESDMVSMAPQRASLYARLAPPGRRDAQPLVLLTHLDTHPADPRAWTADRGPMSGTIADGAVWGRGVLHGKGAAAMFALTLAALRRAAPALARDVILVATADGLSGRGEGLAVVIERYPEIATAGLVLSSGGVSHLNLFGGGRLVHAVVTSERGYARLRLVAAARSDEAGALAQDAVLERLQRALEALEKAANGPKITEPTAQALDYASAGLPLPRAVFYRSSPLAHVFLLPDLARRAATRAMVKDSIRVTHLSGGTGGTLAATDRAQAWLRCGLLPESTPAGIRTRLVRAIGDPDVHVTIEEGAPWSGTPPDEDILARIARHAHRSEREEDQTIVPVMGPEATDARVLRSLGVPVYGFIPMVLDEAAARSIRGRNEHIRIDVLRDAVHRLSSLVMDLAAAIPPERPGRFPPAPTEAKDTVAPSDGGRS